MKIEWAVEHNDDYTRQIHVRGETPYGTYTITPADAPDSPHFGDTDKGLWNADYRCGCCGTTIQLGVDCWRYTPTTTTTPPHDGHGIGAVRLS